MSSFARLSPAAWLGSVWLLLALAGCGEQPLRPNTRLPESDPVRQDPPLAAAPQIAIQLESSEAAAGGDRFLVTGLTGQQLEQLRGAPLDGDQWREIMTVTVADRAGAELPPLWGEYQVTADSVLFQPRFPLRPDTAYRVVFQPGRIPGTAMPEAPAVTAEFPRQPATAPRTNVVGVFPSSDELPENQLKFYIYFSAPMSRGEAYRRVSLLDDAGKKVEFPFLELGEELWNPEATRFTLFFDPGRVKRGLQPREIFGPALEEGRSYTFVVDSAWLDALGRPLEESFRKEFTVAAPDDTQPDVQRWRLAAPPAGSSEPLVVDFDEPLDRAMLERVLSVVDAGEQTLAGEVQVSNLERRWSFQPEVPWSGGRYHLVVDAALEDRAGNSLGRPFEVDVFEAVEKQTAQQTVRVPFEIETAEAAASNASSSAAGH